MKRIEIHEAVADQTCLLILIKNVYLKMLCFKVEFNFNRMIMLDLRIFFQNLPLDLTIS